MADIDIFMHAIRIQESGNHYDAYNPGSGASGAYQFTYGTWIYALSLAGIDRPPYSVEEARYARPAIQDRAARALMTHYYDMFRHSWHAVAEAWYGGPGAVGHPDWGGGPGYPTVGEYADDVMRIYHRLGGHAGGPAIKVSGKKVTSGGGGILGLLRNVAGAFTHEISGVEKWILKLIHAVYSYIDTHVERIWHAISEDYRIAEALFHKAWQYIVSVYNLARWIVDVLIRDVERWTLGLYHDVLRYAEDVYRTLISWVDWLRKYIGQVWHDIVSWVVQDIWSPLKGWIDGAWHWITHEGYLAWYLVTHPDKLSAILAQWVWSNYTDLLKRYGRQIGRWLLHSQRGMINDVITILEDIISGII
jgi:hypothetical protein